MTLSPWFFIKDPAFRKEMENATFMTVGNAVLLGIVLWMCGVFS